MRCGGSSPGRRHRFTRTCEAGTCGLAHAESMEIRPTSAYAMAVAGVMTAGQMLDDDAARVAADPFDIGALVDSTVQPYAAAANVRVLEAARDMDRSLFDAYA
jgi:hypothetical protein